jgi:hypothetical protein
VERSGTKVERKVRGETMELRKNIPHKFDLSGMKPGDKFLGCMDCNIQYDKNSAAKPECFNCGGYMQIYYVTQDDVTPNVK